MSRRYHGSALTSSASMLAAALGIGLALAFGLFACSLLPYLSNLPR